MGTELLKGASLTLLLGKTLVESELTSPQPQYCPELWNPETKADDGQNQDGEFGGP